MPNPSEAGASTLLRPRTAAWRRRRRRKRGEGREPGLGAALLRSLVHRADAWGVAFIVAATALLVHDAVRPDTLALAAAITLMYWLAYTLNDYFDARYDAQEPAKGRNNLFVAHPVSTRTALLVLLGLGTGLALAFGRFGLRGLALLGLFAFIAVAYSAPPLRLKSRPGIDLLVHALFVQTYAYLVCLVALEVAWTRTDVALLALNFVSSLAGQLRQQVRDYALDRRTDRNFATTVGLPTARLCFLLAVAALALLCALALAARALPLFLAPYLVIGAPVMLNNLVVARGRTRSRMLVNLAMAAALAYTLALLLIRA